MRSRSTHTTVIDLLVAQSGEVGLSAFLPDTSVGEVSDIWLRWGDLPTEHLRLACLRLLSRYVYTIGMSRLRQN